MVKQTQTPTIKFPTKPTEKIQKKTKKREDLDLSTHPVRPVVKTNHSTEKCYFGQIAANRLPPRNRRPEGQNRIQQRNAQSNSGGNVQAAAQTLNWKRHVFTPELHVTDWRQLKYQNFHELPRLSGSNTWRQLQIKVT